MSEQNKNTMKKPIFVFISLMGIFAGCQIESINEPSRLDKSAVYEASTEVFTPQTKTSMTSDKQVVWSQNDRLAIFQGCTVADEFLVTDSSAGKTNASFNIVRDNSDVNGSFSAGTEVPSNVAIYPYADGLSLSGSSIDGGTSYEIEGIVLPVVQNYVTGSFGNGAFPMVAVTETMSDHTLRFKNVLGAMKLQFKGTQAVVSIKVEGKNGEKLSGPAIVTAYANGLTPVITMTDTDDSAKSVILDCGGGVQLSESTATEFIIALPPVLFSQGFTVTITDTASQNYTIETDKTNNVLRSSLLVMPEVSLNDLAEEVQTMHKRVLLYYVAGYNNLSSYLKADVEELKRGELPMGNDDVLLVYSHFATSGYNVPTSPTLIRLTKRQDGSLNEQIVATFPAATISSSSECVEEVLALVKEMFPSQSYGMIFSSHATGYLPVGYYQNPENLSGVAELSSRIRTGFTPAPYVEPEYDPSLPMTKSLGQDQVGVLGEYLSYEMNINDFADAIPMHLDYLLFDACLMGGIEVAYELKDMVGKVGFSQTEILVDGFCYENIPTHLLGNGDYDLVSVCSDYFGQYDSMTGVYRSATISLIDCARLDALAELCKRFFDNYSSELSTVDSAGVQRYFRVNKHWFYDLESILVNAGISEDDLIELHEVLDNCVIYKAHTPMFMNDFDIHTFSGFSMYLPCNGSPTLDAFYKKLDWNKDTGLVR